MPHPTQRFSTRVENYIRYRPRYPKEILEFLKTDCGLTRASVIADVGSGTGFLAELFLMNGNKVFGVEPNDAMHEAGKRLMQQFRDFESIAGTAESTSLPNASVDFITAGQAFHWFCREGCRTEFERILRRDGWVVLVWNDRPLIPLLSWRSMSNYFIPTELITTRWTTSGLMPRCSVTFSGSHRSRRLFPIISSSTCPL